MRMSGPQVRVSSRICSMVSRRMRAMLGGLPQLAADGRLRQAALARLEREFEFQDVLVFFLCEISYKRLCDPKLTVCFQVRVLGIVDLRGDGLEAGLVDKEVDVRGAEVVPFLRAQQRAGGTVDGDRIARR